MDSENKTRKNKNRVEQVFTIKLKGGSPTKKEQVKSQEGSIVFRGGKPDIGVKRGESSQPEGEIIYSEHIELENQKIMGRHGG